MFSFIIIYLFVFASFSNTPHGFFQVASFYQIWQASVFHETLSQLPDLWYPNDIFPLCSPTFLSQKESIHPYNIPYFTEINLNTFLVHCSLCIYQKNINSLSPVSMGSMTIADKYKSFIPAYLKRRKVE